MESAVATHVRGRPREFCVDAALAAALKVFWSKGYEGASLTDLTEAMGVTRPSLYAAFGNKEALFRKALDLYEREKLAYIGAALKAATARGVAESLLRGALDMQTSASDPQGCLGVICCMPCGDEALSVRAEVIARRAPAHAALIARLEQAKDEGDLPANADADGLARYLYALLQGMSVQASSGASREELVSLVDTALMVWPSR
jgi:AcrR family transcriptional regulator